MKPALLAAVVAALTVSPAAQAATSGAVGGVRDPAGGVLDLTVQAVENGGVGLRRASVTLGGTALDTAAFAEPDCAPGVCPAVGTVALSAPTYGVPDGPARLEVTVEDAAGTVTHVVDQTITIVNRQPTSTSTVTVSVGAGAKNPQTGPGGPGGPAGPSDTSGCASPRLSMFLAQRPLRIKRGVPVLAAGRKYRFRGRLTCVIDGRRKPAPRGTLVQVRDRRNGRTIERPAARVKTGGAIVSKLSHRRSCTVVFRIRGAGGHLVSVRIPIRVVRAKGARS
jgi:hypothetical protein